MSSDGRIYQVHVANQRNTAELPNATTTDVPLHHSMQLASIQQHLQLTQHQPVSGMQFMAYPSFVVMPNQSQYSFVQPHQNYNHNCNLNINTNTNANANMSLQAGQMLGPNVTFHIMAGGIINSHQASMYPGLATMGSATNGMQAYNTPMAATTAAVAIQRTPGTHPRVRPPCQSSFSNVVVSNPSTSTPPSQRRFFLSQRSNRKYRDYAKDAESNEPGKGPDSASGKDHSFPVKLHRILSDPEFHEYICWMPHGRSWKVLQQDEFEDKVIPLFFRHGKISSFMRQVNGWGFRRMPAGLEKNSYYHEMFLRGFPYLSAKMCRPLEKVRSTSNLKVHPNFHDFKLFVALPKELPVITNGETTSNNDTASNTGSDGSGISSGSGRTSGFETDTTINAASDGSESDQGIGEGVNLSNLYGGSCRSSPNQMHLYGSSKGNEQGCNLYGGSDQVSNLYGSGGSDQDADPFGCDNGSNGEVDGLSDVNNDSNSLDGTGSNNGTISDALSFDQAAAESTSGHTHDQKLNRQLNATRFMQRR